jgi:hypothetical protein
VLSKLHSRQPRLLADTAAMAGALEGLTVTPREAWAGLLVELGLEVNRKLLALQVRGQCLKSRLLRCLGFPMPGLACW